MKTMLYLFLLIALSVGCSHQKDCGCLPSGEKVEFYLLESYDAPAMEHFEISNPTIEDKPFIEFHEIEQYNDATYQFTLKKAAIERIKLIREPRAFAVTVDREIIYTGFFRQSHFSSSCNCIRINPQSELLEANKIWVELGYAPQRDLSDIDRRNDAILLGTLAKARKLK